MKARPFLAVLLTLAALLPGTALAVLGVGDQAPDFNIPDTAWVNHHLTEWRGKVVLLQFWQQF